MQPNDRRSRRAQRATQRMVRKLTNHRPLVNDDYALSVLDGLVLNLAALDDIWIPTPEELDIINEAERSQR